MGAGKSTVGHRAARLAERRFVDTDAEIERLHGPIPTLFEERGEPAFRRLEQDVVAEALAADEPAVVALGGGAVLSERTRALLRRRAFAVHLLVDVDTAWARVRRSGRPLAQDEESFRRRFAEREALYREVADGEADDVDGVLTGALRVQVRRGALADVLGAAEGGAVVADERLAALGWWPAWPEGVAVHAVPSGEPAKSLEVVGRLWDELALGRDGLIVAIGGGTTLDAAGFAAATYLRGVDWVAVPTTLVGQVDASIGGKTGIDLAKGKNLVGAFHLPGEVAVDPDLLATLPEGERRQGMAEVVKTGLLAGRPLWELPEEEMVRACAAFKCAIVLSDPDERGRRAILNLGHTFAHALEAASGYALPHGDAVALGLLAALRLSGQPTDVVEDVLGPKPVRVDREAAWAALGHDKKGRAGRPLLVLLRAPGQAEWGVELPDTEVRAALDSLIAS
jgi:3-dehydroquinate synthetase/shikimate kinase